MRLSVTGQRHGDPRAQRVGLSRHQGDHVRARVEGVGRAAHRLDGNAHAVDVVRRVDLQPGSIRGQRYAHAGGGVTQRDSPGALRQTTERVVQ